MRVMRVSLCWLGNQLLVETQRKTIHSCPSNSRTFELISKQKQNKNDLIDQLTTSSIILSLKIIQFKIVGVS
jgi:hypothetical protein